MGRKSTVLRLPPETRKKLDQALMDGHMTLDELHAFIAEHCKDGETPSRAAIWRYSNNFKEVAQAMRENRESARALAQELGAESVEGEQGRLLVEMLRILVRRFAQKRVADPGAETDLKEVLKLSLSLQALSRSMRLEQDFNQKLREDARREAEKKMEKAVDAVTAAPGGIALTPSEMRERLLAAYRGDA